jgi:hypothetical protein
MRKILILILIYVSVSSLQAQQKYWIVMKDKPGDYTHYPLSQQTAKNRSNLNLPLMQASDIPG